MYKIEEYLVWREKRNRQRLIDKIGIITLWSAFAMLYAPILGNGIIG